MPANRYGSAVLSATQLKVIQEAVSLFVFVMFAWWYFGESPTWRTATAFALVMTAVLLVRDDRPTTSVDTTATNSYTSPP